MKFMKIFIALIFLLILNRTCFAQATVYHPFPVNYGTWNYQYYDDFGVATQAFTLYVMDGDTMIDGQSYNQVFQNNQYKGGLREDAKVIYFYPDTASSEVVLYNFNLHVGDKIIHPYGGAVCTQDTATVIAEDSIPTNNGYRRLITFDSFASWIEGVGSQNYFLQPCNVWCVSGNDFIKCAYGDSAISYSVNAALCVSSVVENASDVSVQVYPNPSAGVISFNLVNYLERDFDFSVYNSAGQEVICKKANQSSKIVLADEKLVRGIYIYKIQLASSVRMGKFIIE